MRHVRHVVGWAVVGAITTGLAGCASTPPQTVDFAVVDNLGHLPMIVGAEKGFFRQHGVDVKLRVTKSGTDIINALNKRDSLGGNMSVTTFLKGRQDGQMVSVFALAMNDATRANADDPLAIIARSGAGITPGSIASLKGKRVGVWRAQTPDEYLKMTLARAGVKESEVEIVNIPSNPQLVPDLASAKVDAVVSLEPWNTLILDKVPGAFLVQRGGGVMSYMMVSTFHDNPVIESNPTLVRNFAAGLAAASHFVRTNPDESIEIFARVVPGVDVATAKKAVRHINYDPRISAESMKAFDEAQETMIKLGSSAASKRLALPKVVLTNYMREVEQRYPQYFRDLKPVRY
jgi:ABC-type nitrate/sulfonate/bicarbonate transport system substrate-binding protein